MITSHSARLFLYMTGFDAIIGIEDNAIRTPRYPTFVRPFSMSSSTLNGFLGFCDRCIRPS
jgi:hypothetical protein